jgi:hypothetical protein
MTENKDVQLEELEKRLQTATESIWKAAQEYGNNSLGLLGILRTLEKLHQEIRDNLFQASLPDNRQALYKLLRDIEAKGGWPYIYRIKLQALLENLDAATVEELHLNSQKPPQPNP